MMFILLWMHKVSYEPGYEEQEILLNQIQLVREKENKLLWNQYAQVA